MHTSRTLTQRTAQSCKIGRIRVWVIRGEILMCLVTFPRYLVLMTTKAELIADVAQSKMTIVEGLQANGSIQAIADAVEHQK